MCVCVRCSDLRAAEPSGDLNNCNTFDASVVLWSSAAAWSTWSPLSCCCLFRPSTRHTLAIRCSRTVIGDNLSK